MPEEAPKTRASKGLRSGRKGSGCAPVSRAGPGSGRPELLAETKAPPLTSVPGSPLLSSVLRMIFLSCQWHLGLVKAS